MKLPTVNNVKFGKIAGSRSEILRACGHWTTVEKPEECAALLAKFYAQRM